MIGGEYCWKSLNYDLYKIRNFKSRREGKYHTWRGIQMGSLLKLISV